MNIAEPSAWVLEFLKPLEGTLGFLKSSILEFLKSLEEHSWILEFFNAYRDRVVTADDPEFEAINLSVVNDDKVAGRLQYVPAKIYSHSQGVYTDGLNQTGIALDALQALQARQQAAEMLPEELR